MDYCNINYCQKSSIGTGPEQCLCQYFFEEFEEGHRNQSKT